MRFFSRISLAPAAVAAAGLGLLAFATPANAQLTFYTFRSDFTLANPGLLSENFENTTGGTGRTIAGAIDSTTAGATSLIVVPGFRVQAVGTTGVPGSGGNQFYYNNTSAYNTGNGTNVLTTNFAADSQDVTFGAGTSAFGVDLGGNTSPYTIRIFDTSGGLLGTTTSTPATGAFSFFGVTSTQSIGRINIEAPSFETTDNMLFGAASGASPNAPEPGSLALLLPLVGAVGLRIRRKRTSAA